MSRAPLDALTGAMRFNIPQEEATIGRGHPEGLHKGGGVWGVEASQRRAESYGGRRKYTNGYECIGCPVVPS